MQQFYWEAKFIPRISAKFLTYQIRLPNLLESTIVSTQLPNEMNAIEITKAGGPEVLVPTKRPVPQPTAGQVLIKVAAAGINFADTQMRQATYAMLPELPCVLGIEVAGTVEALGEGVSGFAAGQRADRGQRHQPCRFNRAERAGIGGALEGRWCAGRARQQPPS